MSQLSIWTNSIKSIGLPDKEKIFKKNVFGYFLSSFGYEAVCAMCVLTTSILAGNKSVTSFWKELICWTLRVSLVCSKVKTHISPWRHVRNHISLLEHAFHSSHPPMWSQGPSRGQGTGLLSMFIISICAIFNICQHANCSLRSNNSIPGLQAKLLFLALCWGHNTPEKLLYEDTKVHNHSEQL